MVIYIGLKVIDRIDVNHYLTSCLIKDAHIQITKSVGNIQGEGPAQNVLYDLVKIRDLAAVKSTQTGQSLVDEILTLEKTYSHPI